MSNFQLNQIITKPTRITQNSTTIIDHVWTERPDMFTDHEVLLVVYSDDFLEYAIRKGHKNPKVTLST